MTDRLLTHFPDEEILVQRLSDSPKPKQPADEIARTSTVVFAIFQKALPSTHTGSMTQPYFISTAFFPHLLCEFPIVAITNYYKPRG